MPMIDANEVKDRLKQLEYEVKESDETALFFCISRVEEHIKNVCNVEEVPEELHYKSIDMVCGEFLKAKLATGELEGYTIADNRLIKTISEGDTTITYQDSSTDSYTELNEFVNGLATASSDLYCFRKLRW